MCHFFHEFLLIISHIPKVFVPVSSWKSSFLFFVFSPETGDSSQTEYINVCAQPVVWASGSPSVKQTNALGYSPATAVYSHCTPSTEGETLEHMIWTYTDPLCFCSDTKPLIHLWASALLSMGNLFISLLIGLAMITSVHLYYSIIWLAL